MTTSVAEACSLQNKTLDSNLHPISVPDFFGGRAIYRWCLTGLAWSLSAGCLLAVLLRLTWKDSLPALAPFFYATPLALVWSGTALASAMFFVLRKSRMGILTAVVAVACWGWWQQTCLFAAGLPVPSDSLASVRVVFWNTARLKAGWQATSNRISEMSAPIMGFVEAGPDQPQDRARWAETFPDHQRIGFGNGMVLLFQGKLREVSQGRLAYQSHYGIAHLNIDEKPITVVLVDLYSSPFYSRKTALDALSKLVNGLPPGPILIMGDFNTPNDSVHFHGLRGGFQNAFEIRGRGDSATWPTPCPVLSLDQMWINSHISVDRVWHESLPESDHQAVFSELAFPE